MKRCVQIDFTGARTACLVETSWALSSNTLKTKIPILKIKTKDDNTHYVSVNSNNNTGLKDSIRINGLFGKCLGLENKDEISIEEIENETQIVRKSVVSCVSEDDWEILESNAEMFSATLLNQLRVVYKGLNFPFWITKSLSINLKIDSLEPELEFGILEANSELIIPSLTSNSSIFQIPNILKLRVHPIQLQYHSILPSSVLVLSNVHHAFIHNSSLPSLHNEIKKFFYGKLVGPNAKNWDIYLKIFIIEQIDLDPNLLSSFPITNPPCIFLHHKLLSDKLPMKSYVLIEEVSEKAFESIPPKYFPVENEMPLQTNEPAFIGLIEEAKNFAKSSLALRSPHGIIGPAFGNLLITGKEGSGKSWLLSKVSDDLSSFPYFVHTELIECAKLRGKKAESIEKELKSALDRGSQFGPSLLLLDDLDILIPKGKADQQNLQEEFQHLKISETMIETILSAEDEQMVVICTVRGFESLDCYWKSREGFHFFGKEIHIPPPTKFERLAIFAECLDRYLSEPGTAVTSPSSPIARSGDKAEGSGNEWADNGLTTEMKKSLFAIHEEAATPLALHNLAQKWALELTLAASPPSAQLFNRVIHEEMNQFGQGKPLQTQLDWNQLGGLKKVKDELIKILQWPIKFPRIFENSPIRMPCGILLYGYPGTGKTRLGLSIPSIINAKFIHIKGPELLSKYIGASEQGVQDLFQRARDSAPCVLFFDEFDSLVPRRGHDSTGVTDRVVNQFLAEMDGIDGGLGKGVYLMAATSRPDLIDPAVLRPGRLDKHLFFDLPNPEEREEILVQLMTNEGVLAEGVDWGEIGRETEGFTGADLHSLIFSSQLEAIQPLIGEFHLNEDPNELRSNKELDGSEKIVLSAQDVKKSLSEFKASLPPQELGKFRQIKNEVWNMMDRTGPDEALFHVLHALQISLSWTSLFCQKQGLRQDSINT